MIVASTLAKAHKALNGKIYNIQTQASGHLKSHIVSEQQIKSCIL